MDDRIIELSILSPSSLRGEESERLARHLGVCRPCGERAAELRAVYRAIGRDAAGDPTEDDRRFARRDRTRRAAVLPPAGSMLRRGDDPLDAVAEIVEPTGLWPLRNVKRFVMLYPLRFAGGFSFSVAGIAAALILFRGPAATGPAYAEIRNHRLSVFDDRATVLWTAGAIGLPDQTSRDVYHGGNKRFVRILDVDGDGVSEVLLTGAGIDGGLSDDTLYCHEASGAMRWKTGGGSTLAFGRAEHTANGIWRVQTSFVVRVPGEPRPRLFALFVQIPWFPGKLAELDPGDGSLLREFWHPGHLASDLVLDVDGDGIPEILLGGINNDRGRAALAVLDPRDVGGHAPMPESLRPAGVPAAAMRAYMLYPRTDLSRAVSGGPYNTVDEISSRRRDGFLVTTREAVGSADITGGIVYAYDRGLHLAGVHGNDSFIMFRKQLRADGTVSGDADGAYYEALRDSVIELGSVETATGREPADPIGDGREGDASPGSGGEGGAVPPR